jgi:hypothetical protein
MAAFIFPFSKVNTSSLLGILLSIVVTACSRGIYIHYFSTFKAEFRGA